MKYYCQILLLILLGIINNMSAQEFWVALPKLTDKNLNSLSFINNTVGWVVGDTGVVVKTTDGGQSWTFQNSGINNDITDVFFVNENLGWALAKQYPSNGQTTFGTYVLKTTNGGIEWLSEFMPDELLNTVEFLDTLNGWLGGQFGTILHTINGGETWSVGNIDSSIFMAHPIRNFRFYSSELGFAAGGRYDLIGAIWRTGNSGNLWSVWGYGPEPINDIHFFDSLNIMAVGGDFEYGASLLESTDGGLNWDYRVLGIFGEATSLSFRTAMEGWATLGFAGKYMYTLNGGKTWFDKNTPNNIPVYNLVFTDSLTGFMVGDSGTILKFNSQLVSLEEPPVNIIEKTKLFPNYPNPFNPTTSISYKISKRSQINLSIFDINGRLVAKLFKGIKPAGIHEHTFDATDLSSGIYLYKITVRSIGDKNKQFSASGKMILLK